MPVMPDHWIRRMARERAMIEPFVDAQKRGGVISYGLSSYGYDARVAEEFRIFTNVDSAVIDPKAFSADSFVMAMPLRSALTPALRVAPWLERGLAALALGCCVVAVVASRRSRGTTRGGTPMSNRVEETV